LDCRQIPSPQDMITRSPIPIYHQLTNLLRNQISCGEWESGKKLPTEAELSKKYGVSRLTIRKAKEKLIKEGRVHSIQGSGSYVTDPKKWPPNPYTIETIDDILAIGKEMAFRMHDFQALPNSADISERLKNPRDSLVFRMSGVRYYLNRPFSYVVYHFPFEIGSKIPLERLNPNPIIPQLEKLAGVKVSEGVHSFQPGRADRKVAEYLGLKRGSLVLIVETTYMDPEGRPIEYVMTKLPKRVGYHIRVKRT